MIDYIQSRIKKIESNLLEIGDIRKRKQHLMEFGTKKDSTIGEAAIALGLAPLIYPLLIEAENKIGNYYELKIELSVLKHLLKKCRILCTGEKDA